MAKKLYVGNLPHSVNDSELQEIFADFGEVVSAKVIMDRETRRSKGFGFVEMGNEDEANAAIEAMHSKEVGGRALTVNVARPMERREGGGGGGGFRSGGGNRRF